MSESYGEFIKDPKLIASVFNNFFVNVGKNIDNPLLWNFTKTLLEESCLQFSIP